MLQGSFQWGSRVFEKVQRGFQGSLKGVSRVCDGSFKCFPRKFLGCFKELSRMFQESFKGVSRKIEECLNKVSKVWKSLFTGTPITAMRNLLRIAAVNLLS